MNYACKSYINVVSYSEYLVYKFCGICAILSIEAEVCLFREMRIKNGMTASPVEQFSPKIGRHKFISGCN